MSEHYRILKPDELPEGLPFGGKGPGSLSSLLRAMEVGDTLTIPAKRRASIYNLASVAGVGIETAIVEGTCYVRRKS